MAYLKEEINKAAYNEDHEKSKKLGYEEIDIELIDYNKWNPNEMGKAKFNLLCDNIKRLGLTKPLEVVKTGERYRVVDGEHRLKACEILGKKKIFCCILDLDEDMQRFQTMRMNMIRGKIDPVKFTRLVDSMSSKYGQEILQDMMGFADVNEFEKLYQEIKRQLPLELRKKLEAVKGEIKSIEGLSEVLNSLFNKYGDTLEYNYMWFDFGKKRNLMIECSQTLWNELKIITDICLEEEIDINELMEKMIKAEYVKPNKNKEKDKKK